MGACGPWRRKWESEEGECDRGERRGEEDWICSNLCSTSTHRPAESDPGPGTDPAAHLAQVRQMFPGSCASVSRGPLAVMNRGNVRARQTFFSSSPSPSLIRLWKFQNATEQKEK